MPTPTLDENLYEKNLELFSVYHGLTAYQIDLQDFNKINFCQTEKGELNLFRKRYGITDYYHSQKGAQAEADESIPEEAIKKGELIFFYGLGLGYAYNTLKSWLKEDSKHHLVFLEDDLEVIKCFLYTELATEILEDPQVTVFDFEQMSTDIYKFYLLHIAFQTLKPQFLVLSYYALRKRMVAFGLCYKVLYDHALVTGQQGEYLSGQAGFLTQFFRNFLHLTETSPGSGLFGQFKGMPAIICGAGPSLEKNIELVKSLKDKALIFAGGSSLNVLNGYGLTPHFGLGIDPNPEQFHRLLTNDTFHLPFFVRPRMTHEAYQLIQGPKLYIPGSINKLATWVEEQLGMGHPFIDEGHNVINFCTEIANHLGCSPVIYVGTDLAFTEIKTYAPGIGVHPLWVGKSTPYEHQSDQILVTLRGINQDFVKTKWDWIAEAEWLGHYHVAHPALKMVNATEGGLGFPPVPNQPLSEVAKDFLQRPLDLDAWIHTEIQTHPLTVGRHQVFDILNIIKRSLDKCLEICQQMKVSAALFGPTSGKVNYFEEMMKEEVAYTELLEMIEKTYFFYQKTRAFYIKKGIGEQLPLNWRFERMLYLESAINQAILLLKKAVQGFLTAPPPVINLNKTVPTPPLEGKYEIVESQLMIEDPELHLFIHESFEFDDLNESTYPEGSLKMKSFYYQQQLHGPSRFYSPTGTLLAETWFIRGQRQGRSVRYYASGKLYSIQRYKDNRPEGLQQFFFENGVLQVHLFYQAGLLEGEVLIYNADGILQRQLRYQKGLRHGVEKMWNSRGNLLFECEYQQGKPAGKAREWDAKGKLIRELNIRDFPKDYDLFVWDEQGKLTQQFLHGVEDYTDYYQEAQDKINYLDGAIKLIMTHTSGLLDQYHAKPELVQELANLQSSLENLKAMKEQMTQIMEKQMREAEEGRQSNQKRSENP